MKILIIGPLGAGKSSLAYAINKKYGISRLNLDEVHRIIGGGYRSEKEQLALLNNFLQNNSKWVMEGCQKSLYQRLQPDLVIDMRINRFSAIWRFTLRFIKAKKLMNRNIPSDFPIQPYHYRKITLQKILEWDSSNREINSEISVFLSHVNIPIITCKGYKDYPKVFSYIEQAGS